MAAIVYILKISDKNLIYQGEFVEKRNICLTITQIRRHVNFGNSLQKPKQKNVRFWHGSTCYVNWAILIGVPVDVTTLLLAA